MSIRSWRGLLSYSLLRVEVEKGSLLHIEELFTGKTHSLLISRTRILTGKASSSFQEAPASLKTRFLAGILGVKNVGTQG